MGELSDRFAELMARMAKSDADLYRTIEEQNADVRQMVDDLVPPEAITAESANTALVASALLPAEECSLPTLKKRFGKVAEAQAGASGRVGEFGNSLSQHEIHVEIDEHRRNRRGGDALLEE